MRKLSRDFYRKLNTMMLRRVCAHTLESMLNLSVVRGGSVLIKENITVKVPGVRKKVDPRNFE